MSQIKHKLRDSLLGTIDRLEDNGQEWIAHINLKARYPGQEIATLDWQAGNTQERQFLTSPNVRVEIPPEMQRPNPLPDGEKKLLAYVSGPYRDKRGTAYVEDNIRAAEEVAKSLWQMGYAVICPHANTRHFDGIVGADDFIEGDLVLVERCDLVVFLPNWAHSQGAKQEFRHAVQHGKPVYLWRDHHEILRQIADARKPLVVAELSDEDDDPDACEREDAEAA